ncbi:fluoride efflux transporter CrcB [Parahaliea aestuarii]|uniref:Fluoride-specific ion channel FluC n=1 Tax=Parahaliea aestuarii TaxID=1852021 RepID=A0A5C9A148_9GAMM|nr:fluoride efflux transporter CrcB [Parahaliea aestuarii]TXS93141.1 fluoride efflux transporter CrcB [Parahaliea aestuarii]
MTNLLFIAIGGAGGALSRYLLSNWVHSSWQGHLPLGTLLVNSLGSFAIGLVFVLIERQVIHPDWRGVLMVGFLGAFTTFSTFSLETVTLIEQGEYLHAGGYILSSVLVCILAAGAGIWLMRTLT